MSLLELFLIGIGLSMDAFAVAICQGLSMSKLNLRRGAVIALFFGGFQALMPLAGWLLASRFAASIQGIDHWVAFVLLLMIGGSMLREALGEQEETDAACASEEKLDLRQLLAMAVATSIDALAVGISFAFTGFDTLSSLKAPLSIIGITSFLMVASGNLIGIFFGKRFHLRMEIFGGLVLIAIGLKILIEHLYS